MAEETKNNGKWIAIIVSIVLYCSTSLIATTAYLTRIETTQKLTTKHQAEEIAEIKAIVSKLVSKDSYIELSRRVKELEDRVYK
jgi:hypothetical protein